MTDRNESMWDRRSNSARDWESSELDLALRGEECPACALARQTEEAVLFWLSAANVRDPDSIERIVGAGGLCATHWANLLDDLDGDPGIAGTRLIAMLIEKARRDLARPSVPESHCPVCSTMARRASEGIAWCSKTWTIPAAGMSMC